MLTFFRTHVGARLATIWLVVAIPLVALLLVTDYEWYSARMSLVEQERREYAESVATSFKLLVSDIRYSLRSTGGDIAVAPSSPSSQAELQRLVSAYPAANVVFTDASGRILGSSQPGLVGESVSQDTAFLTATRASGGFGMEPSQVSNGGLVGFHIAQIIPARSGRHAGVMVMLIDVRRLHQSFPVQVPVGGISVIDSSGQVVFQNENARFAETRARWGDEFPFVQQALRGRVAVTRDFQFPGDGRRIGVFAPIAPEGWAAGSSVAPGVVLAPFYRAADIGFPLALTVVSLALLVSIVISRRIRRSLGQLAEDAGRIGSGQLEEPVRADRDDEIGEVARSLEASRIELREARQHAERQFEAEHRVAETLQSALLLLPERIQGIRFAHVYYSATEAARVGGDFYDLFELQPHRLGITIGDMSGHGIDAAALTSLVKNAIRVLAAQQDRTPNEVMAGANQILHDNSPIEVFATAFFGVLDLGDGRLDYCSAGHTTGAWIRANGGVRKLSANSGLIGAFPGGEFELSTERIGIDDLLFLYTDGLTEARRDAELFGEERLFELLAHERGGDPQKTLRGVVDTVLAFAGGRLSDDLAVLAVKRGEASG